MITSPLKLKRWEDVLVDLPDRQLKDYLLRGITEGFRIGFDYNLLSKLRSSSTNLLSAAENPDVVDSYLAKELHLGRIAHVSDPSALPFLQYSPFGVIPKKYKPGKWRLIFNLSAPHNHSVNDGILKELCSFSYVSVDDVVSSILLMGRGTLMAKLDIKEAYRMVPVHPEDRLLLGMKWKDQTYIDKTLPFGLRSAPLIFTAVGDGIEWAMRKGGVQCVFHYVDDFITLGRPGSDECTSNLATCLQICSDLGAPIEVDKCEGPATCLPFLGIEIDTVQLELRLPLDKLQRVRELVIEWRGKKACTKRELLSLIGLLQHAAKVVKPGRTFVRRMIDLSMIAKKPQDHLRLNKAFRSDLEWWHYFVGQWNGISLLAPFQRQYPDEEITSDASGSWGCGAFHGSKWFQLKWEQNAVQLNIMIKELIPIVIAVMLWGNSWAGMTIQARCDNQAVVEIINRRSSKDQEAMHLLRCLSFAEARFGCFLTAKHIAGIQNTLAYALS